MHIDLMETSSRGCRNWRRSRWVSTLKTSACQSSRTNTTRLRWRYINIRITAFFQTTILVIHFDTFVNISLQRVIHVNNGYGMMMMSKDWEMHKRFTACLDLDRGQRKAATAAPAEDQGHVDEARRPRASAKPAEMRARWKETSSQFQKGTTDVLCKSTLCTCDIRNCGIKKCS